MRPCLFLLLGAFACGAARAALAQEPIPVAPGALPNGLPSTPATLDLPEVDVPERQAVLERGTSPVYFRLPDTAVAAWSRSAFGVHVGLPTNAETDALAEETEGARFTLDLLGGVELTFDRREHFSVIAELGYSYVYEDSHWFVAGFGPALHRIGPSTEPDEPRPTGEFAIALVPHVVVGSIDDHFAYGLRSSLLLRWNVLGVELAHQFARAEDLARTVHELHFTITLAYSTADL